MSKYSDILERLSTTPSWSPQHEAALLEPYTYITANPGKEVRSALIEAFNGWLNVPADQLQVIAKVVRMLHNASLLVDDIEDDSQLRRGQPVAHKIYGIPQTINTGNYVYFLAYQELFNLRNNGNGGNKALERLVTEELMFLHRGQGLEILWRDSLRCPTEEEYIEMVNNKTGGLIRIGIKLMMACATTRTEDNFVPLVNLIGVLFQIRDDYMNLQSGLYTNHKGFAEDLTEGKFSFPVVHGIHADSTNRQVINVLQKRPTTPTLKKHTISYLETHTNSFAYTRTVLKELEDKIQSEIQRLGGNAALERIINSLRVKEPTKDL